MSSIIQTRHKSLLRDIRKFMRTQPVTQASVMKECGITQTMASILLRELIAMGQVQKTHKIRSTGRASIYVYELTEAYLATLRQPDDTQNPEQATAPFAPLATEAQAVLELTHTEPPPAIPEPPTAAPAEPAIEAEAPTQPQEPERKDMREHAIPVLAGIGLASICIWLAQSLHLIPGFGA